MDRTADAVIIGGGIMGASAAYFLTKLGFGKVVLLEKHLLASGATGHSAANVRQHYSNEVTVRLAKRAVEMFSAFHEELGYPCGFEQVGYMIMAREEDRPAIEHVVRLQQKFGVDARLISREDVRELSPDVDLSDIVGGCYESKSGYADPRATVYALAHRAQELGARIEQLAPVRAIERKGDRVTGVTTSRGAISTRLVVNCAGPWADRIGHMVGIHYSLRFSRELDVKFQLAAKQRVFPVSADPRNGTYFRPQSGGFAIAGLTFPKDIEPCDPESYNDKATAGEVEFISAKLGRRMPRISEGLPVAGWAGVYSITDDWHPIVGDMPGFDGYYHFHGGSGHGFKIAPPIGEALADIIAGKKPAIDISPLHFSRFEKGGQFWSAWGAGNRA
ncbi:MAG: FAD-binding oxidoreductase [Acidobacteria bacterium]|nr:FAD-binding oxidoreductase [Acidobacteriota bacterium]